MAIASARPPSASSAIRGTNRSAWPRPITSCRWSASSSASNRATEPASLADSLTRVGTGEAPSVVAVEAVEIRDRKSVVEGKRQSVRVGIGGGALVKKKHNKNKNNN